MSDNYDESLKEVIRLLETATKNLTEEEKHQARLLAEYFRLLRDKQDHEGTQSFPVEDYKRRN